MKKTRLILIRHGHVEGIDPKKFRGRSDFPLTETGLEQARQTARFLEHSEDIAAIYCSPLKRCVATAEAIANLQKIDVQPVSDLIDIDYGAWQGRSEKEVEAADPETYKLWITAPDFVSPPEGESLADVNARVSKVLNSVLAVREDSAICLVGHDSTNRVILCKALGLSLSAYRRIKQDPCSISILLFFGDQFEIVCMNQTAHLPLSNEIAIGS